MRMYTATAKKQMTLSGRRRRYQPNTNITHQPATVSKARNGIEMMRSAVASLLVLPPFTPGHE